MKTPLKSIAAVMVAGFGFFCLNYTKAFGVDHHYEWAAEHGFPEPSAKIYFLGVASLALGSAFLGHTVGRARGGR